MKKTSKRFIAMLLTGILLMVPYIPSVSSNAEEIDEDIYVETEEQVSEEDAAFVATEEPEIYVDEQQEIEDTSEFEEEEDIKALSDINETFNPATDYTPATSADVGKAATKKGIQGTEWRDRDSAIRDSDPDSLGVDHVLLNLDLSKVIYTEKNKGTAEPELYTYNGSTYKFHYNDFLIFYEWRVRELVDEGKTVTLVLLLPTMTSDAVGNTYNTGADPELRNLIYPGALLGNEYNASYFTALNAGDAAASQQLAATFHYLADKFSYSQDFVENWIVGNEVNVPTKYNYTGTSDKATNVTLCVQTFDLMYQAIQDESPYSKLYISLTHNWQNDNGGDGIPTKDFLDSFAGYEGSKKWNIAFHAYPPNMKTSMLSKKAGTWLRHDADTSFVCGVNLEQLTGYVKSKYGTSHRIILSEQSYDSKNLGEDEQAAMIAYTYYAGDRDDMVDAVIFSSWMDSSSDIHEGYNLGIVNADGSHKKAYNVFKYMNKDSNNAYVKACLTTLGLSKWTDYITYSTEHTDENVESASINVATATVNEVKAGLTTVPENSKLDIEYKWSVSPMGANSWTLLKNWTLNDEMLTWKPSGYGNYTLKCEYRVPGNDKSGGAVTKDFAIAAPTTNAVDYEAGGIYIASETKDGYFAGMVTKTTTGEPLDVEYCWISLYKGDPNAKWETVSDWQLNNEWVSFKPDKYGDYYLAVQYRVPGNPDSTGTYVADLSDYDHPDYGYQEHGYHPYIQQICQMPYDEDKGGGYLIGFETYDNPNQEYHYEMYVMDLSLVAAGSPTPWVHSVSVKLPAGSTAAEGKTLWTVWQPQYGFYITLFRLVDKDGNIIDEKPYPFVNAF